LTEKKKKYLLDWNFIVLDQILLISGIECAYSKTLNFVQPENTSIADYRESIHPKTRMQKNDPYFEQKTYYQVFRNKFGFTPNLSFIDLLFNEGPEAEFICKKCIKKGQ